MRECAVTWSTSSDIHEFIAAAGDYLASRPVENTVLLTEAAYLAARPSTADDQLYGWWKPLGSEIVAGAFLQAPAHCPVLSPMDADALDDLAISLPHLPPFGVDTRLAAAAVGAWRRHCGIDLSERPRLRLHRLGTLRIPAFPSGHARKANLKDRELLVDWYEQLMAKFPGDPSELGYVVDDPISYGGMTLWEDAGTPEAMASHSRVVAGMTRVGAAFAPRENAYTDAALVAACMASMTSWSVSWRCTKFLTMSPVCAASWRTRQRSAGFQIGPQPRVRCMI